MSQNAKWDNMRQVFAQATQTADLQAMGLTQLVQQASTLTSEIEQLLQQGITGSVLMIIF